MKSLARDFDLPIDSLEHSALAESAWMGGSLVSVRFYLGRLLNQNLFRQTDAEVEQKLVEYVSGFASTAGAELMRGTQGWEIAAELVRYRFEMQTKQESALNARQIAAI